MAGLREQKNQTSKSVLDTFENLDGAVRASSYTRDRVTDSNKMIGHKHYDNNRVCYSMMPKDPGLTLLISRVDGGLLIPSFDTKIKWFFGEFVTFTSYSRRVAPFFYHDDSNKNGMDVTFSMKQNVTGELNTKLRVDMVLTFEETKMQLLPAPYATDCFDYASNGFGSKACCRQKCLSDYGLRTHKSMPRNCFIPPGSELDTKK